jgi:hypothetical protein
MDGCHCLRLCTSARAALVTSGLQQATSFGLGILGRHRGSPHQNITGLQIETDKTSARIPNQTMYPVRPWHLYPFRSLCWFNRVS